MQIGTYGDLGLLIAIVVLFNLIYPLLTKMVKLLENINEALQRGLHKEIMQSINEKAQGQHDALLMKHKMKEARKKAGEPEPEDDSQG